MPITKISPTKQLISYFKRHSILLLIIVYLLYSFIQIYRSSFVLDNIRYFSLFDDMMISMRYAFNLAQGYGLVWNPGGERVEGFTNLLWTLYMAVIHLLPVSLAKTSFIIQASGAICMALTMYFVWKTALLLSKNSQFIAVVSVLFTAFYYPLFNWSVILGTEVSLLTLLLTWGVYLAVKALQTKKFSIMLFLVLGVGTLVRMDFLVPALAITLLLFIFDKINRKKYLLLGLPIIGLFILSQTIFRLWYYNELLPNTFYLKATGYPLLPRIFRGAYVALQSMNWMLIAIPFIYLYFARSKYIALLLASFVSVILYSIYVGGDAWEYLRGANRYVAVAMPVFFISFAIAIHSIKKMIAKYLPAFLHRFTVAEVVFLAFCFLIFNSSNDNSLLVLSLIKKPLTVGENQNQVRIAQNINSITKENAKVAVVWAGIIPYFSPREYIDVLGKNEKVIARGKAHYNFENQGSLRSLVSYWPGHNKWDYHYVVTRYKPDIFGQSPFPDDEKRHLLIDYSLFISETGNTYYIHKASKKIKYDTLTPFTPSNR